jgi:sRNA-binding carbon storage regulator CsrA
VLILSRKVDEGLVLTCPDGTRIDVMVTDIRKLASGRPVAKLGITAPAAVLVRRDELPELHVYTEGTTDVATGDSDG